MCDMAEKALTGYNSRQGMECWLRGGSFSYVRHGMQPQIPFATLILIANSTSIRLQVLIPRQACRV